MEFNLVNAMSRETALRNYLSEVKDKYDYILIDCINVCDWKRIWLMNTAARMVGRLKNVM